MSSYGPPWGTRPGLTIHRFLVLAVLGLIGAIALSLTQAQAQTEPEAQIGFVFEGSQTFNAVTLTAINYTGDCPGASDPEVRAWFVSSTSPPAPDHRVLIRNVTTGMNPDDYPYTNRDYDEGRVSAPTTMQFGTEHGRRRFRVLPGLNQFEYQITDKDTDAVIEAGSFTALIQQTTTTQDRPSSCRREQACANSSVGISACADIRWRTQCSCPNGSVVRTQWETRGAVRTLISNQSRQGVSYQLGGRRYFLNSGQDRWFTGENLGSVQFTPSSGASDRSVFLTPGTRYRFTDTGSGQIDLSVWYR